MERCRQQSDLITTHHHRIRWGSTARPAVNVSVEAAVTLVSFFGLLLAASVRLDDADDAPAAVEYLWFCPRLANSKSGGRAKGGA